MTKKNNVPLLVILDLDETLIHTSEKPLTVREHDFTNEYGFGYIRPGAVSFVRDLLKDPRYKVMIWTSGNDRYANNIVNALGIDKSDLVLFYTAKRITISKIDRESVYYGEYHYKEIKTLIKVKRSLKYSFNRMIAIDDDEIYYERQYSNQIKIPKYIGNDNEVSPFPVIRKYLSFLSDKDDVRPFEKRGIFTPLRSAAIMNGVFEK